MFVDISKNTRYNTYIEKERRQRTRGCNHQHARHVVVALGVLFLFIYKSYVL